MLIHSKNSAFSSRKRYETDSQSLSVENLSPTNKHDTKSPSKSPSDKSKENYNSCSSSDHTDERNRIKIQEFKPIQKINEESLKGCIDKVTVHKRGKISNYTLIGHIDNDVSLSQSTFPEEGDEDSDESKEHKRFIKQNTLDLNDIVDNFLLKPNDHINKDCIKNINKREYKTAIKSVKKTNKMFKRAHTADIPMVNRKNRSKIEYSEKLIKKRKATTVIDALVDQLVEEKYCKFRRINDDLLFNKSKINEFYKKNKYDDENDSDEWLMALNKNINKENTFSASNVE